MPACWASCSLILNLTSQLSVSWVCWAALSGAAPGESLAAWPRLVTSVSRVAMVIRWLPTIAAAPILTGEHPATRRPAPSTAADTLTRPASTRLFPLITLLPPAQPAPTGSLRHTRPAVRYPGAAARRSPYLLTAGRRGGSSADRKSTRLNSSHLG